MTPAQLRKVANAHGGARQLAERLHVSKDWVYRRISGETPIRKKDEMAIHQVMPRQS
ncbi:MAG TPA: hypothetical protein VFE62_01305 [Gemmataceae bacterium]|nr:hypothetical protein [Gemmataceae bacterium]